MNEALIAVDKVPGPTSFDVVRQVREALGGAKVGHAGSLDPFASGVLVLLVGKATKLSGLLLNADKRYRAVVRLGQWTDTLDPTGTVEKEAPIPELSQERIEAVLKGFLGTWAQVPPMYSAKKLHGVRLYDLARQDIRVRRKPIEVQLHEVRFQAYSKPDLTIDVHCSKGTYIRSLAEEIGVRLGTVAHLVELRRVSCGQYFLEDCLSVEQIVANPQAAWHRGVDLYRRLLQQEMLVRREPRHPREPALGAAIPPRFSEVRTIANGYQEW